MQISFFASFCVGMLPLSFSSPPLLSCCHYLLYHLASICIIAPSTLSCPLSSVSYDRQSQFLFPKMAKFKLLTASRWMPAVRFKIRTTMWRWAMRRARAERRRRYRGLIGETAFLELLERAVCPFHLTDMTLSDDGEGWCQLCADED